MKTLTQAVRQLHGSFTITLEFVRTPRNMVQWKKTVTGEDFLDGTWERTYTGKTRTQDQAMEQALKAGKQ